MSHELKEGLELTAIFFVGDKDSQFTVGALGCLSIVVVEQPGQMGMVPWAKVSFVNGAPRLVNLSQVESVAFKEHP